MAKKQKPDPEQFTVKLNCTMEARPKYYPEGDLCLEVRTVDMTILHFSTPTVPELHHVDGQVLGLRVGNENGFTVVPWGRISTYSVVKKSKCSIKQQQTLSTVWTTDPETDDELALAE